MDGKVIRLIIGVVIAIISVFSYFASQEYNPITDEDQHLAMTKQQEIRLGQENAPRLIDEYGGLAPDDELQQQIDRIGQELVNDSVADDTEWEWEFHVLDAPDLVNAFALPGGQIFITTALLERFEGEGDIAAVLAHEIVHVLGRHSAEQMAKAELTNGLVGAVAVASGDASATQAAAVFGQLINMKYSRDHEHQADTIGICLLIDAGYPPEEMIDVMQVLAQASGGQAPPEFMSTHPSSDNRIEEIEEAIANADEDCPD